MIKVLETIPKLISWVQIFFAPFIVSVIIAAIVYLANPESNIIFSSLILLVGFVTGVLLAERIRKRQGTEAFMTRVNASPDLDSIRKGDRPSI